MATAVQQEQRGNSDNATTAGIRSQDADATDAIITAQNAVSDLAQQNEAGRDLPTLAPLLTPLQLLWNVTSDQEVVGRNKADTKIPHIVIG